MKAGRLAEARERFELARDLDVLRFRADSRINAVIREVAGEQEAAGVRLGRRGAGAGRKRSGLARAFRAGTSSTSTST